MTFLIAKLAQLGLLLHHLDGLKNGTDSYYQGFQFDEDMVKDAKEVPGGPVFILSLYNPEKRGRLS